MNYKEIENKLKIELLGNDQNKGYLLKLQERIFDNEQYENIKSLICSINDSLRKETKYDNSILDLIEWSNNFYGETLMFFYKQNKTQEFYGIYCDWLKSYGNEYKAIK